MCLIYIKGSYVYAESERLRMNSILMVLYDVILHCCTEMQTVTEFTSDTTGLAWQVDD